MFVLATRKTIAERLTVTGGSGTKTAISTVCPNTSLSADKISRHLLWCLMPAQSGSLALLTSPPLSHRHFGARDVDSCDTHVAKDVDLTAFSCGGDLLAQQTAACQSQGVRAAEAGRPY